jgi:hypothetical protein
MENKIYFIIVYSLRLAVEEGDLAVLPKLASNLWVQVTLLSQPPEELGLLACASMPGL